MYNDLVFLKADEIKDEPIDYPVEEEKNDDENEESLFQTLLGGDAPTIANKKKENATAQVGLFMKMD